MTPSSRHSLEVTGLGESATVGVPPPIANAVVEALARLEVTYMDVPTRLDRLWGASVGRRVGG